MSDEARKIGDDWVSAMPLIYMQIQKAIDDPDSTFKDIGKIISGDAALTSRLLKIVNSSFYGFSGRIETIAHALNIVGTVQLSDLVLAMTAIRQFPGVSKDLISMDSFWRHSIAVGLFSRELAENTDEPEADRFYVAGMLHDIGSLVIFKKMPTRSADILAQCADKDLPLHEVERQSIGFDHAAVGEALLKAWKLPPRLVEAVACHHTSSRAKDFPLEAAILHVADILAYEMKLGSSGVVAPPAMERDAWELIGLPDDKLESVKKEVDMKFSETVTMFLTN